MLSLKLLKLLVVRSIKYVYTLCINCTDLSDILEAPNHSPVVESLQQPKAPVRRELRMADNQKGECHIGVSASHCTPQQVLYHYVVFVLACTVVCM